MHFLHREKKDLRAKPSLPDLKQQSTAAATRLNSLDLAQTSPQIDRRASPVPSPRLRQSMPLTPPLTPSSSLDGARTLPEPSTPVDSPVIAAAGKETSGRPYVSLGDAPPLSRLPTENDVSRYLHRDRSPTRFVLVTNLPTNASIGRITALFGSYGGGGVLKGIWGGQLASHGILVIIYFNLKDAEAACRHYACGAVVADEMLIDNVDTRGAVRTLSAGYLSLEEAKRITCTGENPASPVTQIEAEAAFFVHLYAPDEQRTSYLRAMLERFGPIFVMEPRGWETGGEWSYVEFFDTRDTGIALHNAEVVAIQQGLRIALQPTLQGMSAPFAPAPAPPPPPPVARVMSPFYGGPPPMSPISPIAPFAFQPALGPGFPPAPRPFYAAPPPTPFVPPPTPFLGQQFPRPVLPMLQMQMLPPPTPASTIAELPGMFANSSPPLSARPFSPSPTTSSPTRPTRRPRASLNTGASHIPPPENTLDLAKIERGVDMRTTVMIKNIPNKISDRELLNYINDVVPRRVDFFYLRMDFQNGCNVGYAFVNFITVDDLLCFAKARLGTRWNMYSSEKVLQMSYANYQGKEALVEKFKNSGIMDEREAWRPKIFHSAGPSAGLPELFPPATHQRRKERSAHNRGALFVPGLPRY
ncbi:unnamed protein product [Peniophora sp. CBMAI 1063]|nr:unnamed protein product [Peniophora sp. CBMAI 1063]